MTDLEATAQTFQMWFTRHSKYNDFDQMEEGAKEFLKLLSLEDEYYPHDLVFEYQS